MNIFPFMGSEKEYKFTGSTSITYELDHAKLSPNMQNTV